ncbi:MAG: SMC-Scp complex subunit ScpB [Alphaproteobacteria bacterium]|nr:MAG: SMC-Scp complex subunit ScpB [Alphaproteobacteria bacterium]
MTAATNSTAPLPLFPEETEQCLRALEAMIFASREPVMVEALARRMGAGVDVGHMLAELAERYQTRGINLVETALGWSFRTAVDLAPYLQDLAEIKRRLPRASLETLAIVAYHQPVTRAEIESIRGVATSKGTLDMLLELGWVRPGRRRETPGRPLTWITTPTFLDAFGLESLKDLPGLTELQSAGLLDARPVLALPNADEESGDVAPLEAEDSWHDEEVLEEAPAAASA